MRIICTFFLLVFCFAKLAAQHDSIYIQAKISADKKYVTVHQEIIYHNPLNQDLNKIKLLNWISAYKNRRTSLLFRQLEDRKKNLYFAKKEDLGDLQNLEIRIGNSSALGLDTNRENLYIPLSSPLQKGKSVKINLDYTLKIPAKTFTGYGTGFNGLNLKYFFLVPDSFENEKQSEKNYIDIEETQTCNTFWKILLEVPPGYFSKSNLPEVFPHYFEGTLKIDPEFLISETGFPSTNLNIDGQNVKVDFGYPLSENEKENLEFYLPLHLKFIKNITGLLPEKIFLSEKFRKEEDFIGNDDIRFWKFHYKLFTDAENTDMDYFGMVAKNILNQNFAYDKNGDHWLINGLKTYLEIRYINQFYKERNLLGDLPEEVRLLGIRPLKWFYASKLKLSERYGLAYQYIESENLDQKINERFSELSNFNKTAISHFETGSLIGFVSEKMGNENFENFLKNYISENRENKVNTEDFLNNLAIASNYSSDFLDHFIEKKQRVNFRLKNYRKEDDNFQVKIVKNTPEKIPFKIETEEKNGQTKTFWFDTNDSEKPVTYNIPQSNASKILVNNDYIFPESKFRDNYLYTKGIFANAKKLKIKLFKDIPNPEYNEIYVNPRVNFNAYDKLLLGVNFKNTSLFREKLAYSVTPYYSTGTQKITGTAGASYTFMPAESFFRSLQLGVSGSYFHYDYDLQYSKVSTFASINFTKNPRSDIGRSLYFSYNYYQKDLTPEMVLRNDYAKYNLWSLNYNYYNQRLIHENYIGGGLQWMEDFRKISAEAFYRYEYAKNKKISFRFFGGYFLSNHTKNNLFNFGVSRVSNYSFSYGLIGQSAASGILSQQLIIADGGFKSFVAPSVNQWIGAVNVDSKIWKWFNIYADAGIYKNKYRDPEFIWDSGIKLAVIPDFLELYFPMQSSLGFEPSFKDYGKRIRFTLVLNFGAIANTFRKGVF